MTITDAQINAKYESGINTLITENNRIKLPKLVENIRLNPKYMWQYQWHWIEPTVVNQAE